MHIKLPSVLSCLTVLTFLSLGVQPGYAEDYVLTIKDHAFTPKDITIPVDQKVKLIVKNAGDVPAEFESSDLNREKILTPGSEVAVIVGPLNAGSYKFYDDFHRETTGTLTAR